MPMPSGTASDDPARAAAYEIGKRQIVAALGNQNPVAAVGAVPPSTAAMAAPPPPVPPSLPPGAAPTLPGAVVPRSEPTVPANMVPYIRGLMNLNTFTRGQTELDRYSKPNEYDYKPLEDGSFLAFNKNNPNDRHHIPGNSQALIDFHAQKQGRAAAAEQAVKLSPEAIRARAEEAGLTERAQGEAKKAVAKPDLDKIRQEAGKVVVDDIDRVLKLSRGQTWNDPVTGLTGQLASNVPGTKAHNAAKLIDTIKANSAFDALQQMRQASPTGAALGAVTDKEIYKLEVARGNLEQSQETEQFEDNLKRYKNIFMDIIHGEGKGPAREKLDYKSRGIKGTTTSGVKWSVE
jgi:hypothetical protein